MDGPHPYPTPTFEALAPGSAAVLGNLDPPCAQMTPDFQGLAQHVNPARQVLISTFHPLPGGSGAMPLGMSRTCMSGCPLIDPRGQGWGDLYRTCESLP